MCEKSLKKMGDFVISAKPAPEVSSPGAGIQSFDFVIPAKAGIQSFFELFDI